MRLYFIRHAAAEPLGEAPDAERRLSAQGRGEAGTAGRALRSLGAKIDLVLSSPLVRARETANLIAEGLDPQPTVDVREGLAPGAAPDNFIKAIGSATGREVAIVGHQPDLGHFLAAVLDLSGSGVISFKPCSVCCLDVDADFRFKPVWFRHPEELASLLSEP